MTRNDSGDTDQREKIEVLHDVATDIMACRTKTAVYEETVAAAERILEFDMCCTMIYDDGMLRPLAVSSGAPAGGARPMHPDEGDAGYVYQTGKPRILNDTQDNTVSKPAKDTYRSGISVPVGDVGVFQAVSDEPGDFSQKDVELAELLLSHAEARLESLEFEETLEAERDRFRSLFQLTTDAISESKLEGDAALVRRVNPAFEETFGYETDEVVGEALDDLVTPPEELEEGLDLNRRSREGERIEREVTRQTPEGPREFLLRSVPYELADEQRCFAVYTDITEQKRMRRRFRALIEHSSDIVTVLQPDGTIEYVSPSSERILGFEPAELLGEDAFEFAHPADRERVTSVFEEAVTDHDATPTVEYRYRDADDEWRHLESRGTNRLDDPAVEGFVVNTRDVTQRRKRLEILEKLPVAAGRLRAAADEETAAEATVETARDVLGLEITGLWLYDDNVDALVPVAQTPEARKLVGDHPRFESDGESLSWRAFEDGEPRIYDDVRQEDRIHNPDTPVRSEMVLPLGDYGVVNVGDTERKRFGDVDVYFARILAAMAESTFERLDHEATLRQQQRELERKNERLDAFASVVSHDLRNPLNVADGYLELVETADQDHVRRIEAAHQRMATILEDVLTLAREGEAIGDPEPVDLTTVVEGAWANVATASASLDIDCNGRILADESRVHELFENLFRNSVEHGGSEVSVRVECDGATLVISDDGPGIEPEHRDRVLDSGYSTTPNGTGLGLAIVREIAEAHGWSVSVSESAAGGTRFEFAGVERP